MRNVDALITGGSAAGFAPAMTARRHYPEATLAVNRQEDRTPVPCGIPYIYGTVGSAEKNLMPGAALAKMGLMHGLGWPRPVPAWGTGAPDSRKFAVYTRLTCAG